MALQVLVTIKGPAFSSRIDNVVKAAIVDEALEKFGKRMERGGRGLGSRRNTISRKRHELTMDVTSTLVSPRTKGTAWRRKNIAIAKSMMPRVLRSTARRIVGELG